MSRDPSPILRQPLRPSASIPRVLKWRRLLPSKALLRTRSDASDPLYRGSRGCYGYRSKEYGFTYQHPQPDPFNKCRNRRHSQSSTLNPPLPVHLAESIYRGTPNMTHAEAFKLAVSNVSSFSDTDIFPSGKLQEEKRRGARPYEGTRACFQQNRADQG